MMARTNPPLSLRNEDTPELSELMAPFMISTETEGRLTPYRVAVLVVLEQYITFEAPEDFSPAEKRGIALGFLKLFRATHRPYSDLKRIICEEFGSDIMRALFEAFTKRALVMELDLFISMLYGCIAALIFDSSKPSIKTTSVSGQFTRKLFIGYKKSTFSEICRLWTQFREYFKLGTCPAARDVEFLDTQPSDGIGELSTNGSHLVARSNDCDVALTNGRQEIGQHISTIPNRKEALAFITKQVFLFERDPAAALSYSSVAQWIGEIQKHLPDFHELYFLEYVNELRIKNLLAAESALHRYVDNAGLTLMHKNILDTFASDHRLTGPATNIIPTSAFRSLRYGPLLLADMHRRFGNQEKALAYLHECIKNAEEANDKACLDYAVALFFMLECAGKRNDFRRLIDQALADTEDRNATGLHFRCHLVHLLRSVSDCDAAKSIIDAKHLIFSEICEKTPSVTNGNGKSERGRIMERFVTDILRAVLSSAYLQRGYWNAACLEAQKLIYSMTEKTASVLGIAAVNLAYGLAAKGRYIDAKTVLANSKVSFPMFTAERDRLHLAEALISFEVAFLEGNDEDCRRNIERIEAFSTTEAKFRKAIYHCSRDTFSVAVDLMTKFLREDAATNPYIKCRILLILGDIFLHRSAKVGIAEKYFGQCYKLSEEYRFPHLATMASYKLAEVQAMLCPAVSRSWLMEQLPTREENAYLSSLQCISIALSVARMLLRQNPECDTKGATKAVQLLETVLHQLEPLNASLYQRQAYALLAIAHQRLGNIDERNRMSKMYREHHERLVKSGFTALAF